jgi:adenine phosphoribosyltransferase
MSQAAAAIDLAAFVTDVPDFPKPGIVFKDITPLLANPAAFAATVDQLAEAGAALAPDALVAIESRGFLFGAALAQRLGLPLQLVRKRGKLPRASVSVPYELEYGVDHLEMHADAVHPGARYVIVDDVLATGGTAAAVAQLIEEQQGRVAGAVFVIELGFLGGRRRLGARSVSSVIRY